MATTTLDRTEAARGSERTQYGAPARSDSSARIRRPAGSGRNVGNTERLASVVGGGSLTLYGLQRGDTRGLLTALLGATILQRGLTGRCQFYGALGISTAEDAQVGSRREVELFAAVSVQADPNELYEMWRDPANLPRFMTFLDGVDQIDDTRAHWRVKAPLGQEVGWDAEIVDEVAGRRIAWQTVDESLVRHRGEVRFRPGPKGRGTEVELHLHFTPPGGQLGADLASLFDGTAEMKLRGDLKRFKQWAETGEIATTEGQPSGRR
jgi:uncharacterized membrane protein